MYSLNLLLSLVRDLLDLNSLKTDKFKVVMASFNPSKAITFVFNLLQIQAGSQKLNMEFKMVEGALLKHTDIRS